MSTYVLLRKSAVVIPCPSDHMSIVQFYELVPPNIKFSANGKQACSRL